VTVTSVSQVVQPHASGQVAPDLTLALVAAMRTGLGINGPPDAEQLKLLAEEHVNDLADRLELLIRAPKGCAGF